MTKLAHTLGLTEVQTEIIATARITPPTIPHHGSMGAGKARRP